MIYPNKPLYLLSLLGYIYRLTYYTLTTKDNIILILLFYKLNNLQLPLSATAILMLASSVVPLLE